jgi:branched-chain amino acid transport system ATP-binding protein
MMLEVRDITKQFDGLTVLNDVSTNIEQGTIKGLIGPNGAGKTTLFNLVSGVLRPSQGKISFLGKDITRQKPETIAAMGVSRTFQQPHLFETFTVRENVMLGYDHRTRSGLLGCGFTLKRSRQEQRVADEASVEYLTMMGLENKMERIANELPLGEQRHLEVARALAMQPKLLLLDEPASGLNDHEVNVFSDILLKIRSMGISLFIIEHRIKFVMDICDQIIVLNFGTKIAEGTPKEVRECQEVIEAYLGAEQND